MLLKTWSIPLKGSPGASWVPIIGIAALLLWLLAGCSRDATGKAKAEDPRKKMAMPVTVADVIIQTVPVQLTAIGSVQSYSKVVVKAQVAGEITRVHFKEGEAVKKGDLLFTIDPASLEAEVRLAEANLAKDRAQLENARKQLARYTSVVSKGYVSAEEYDKVLTNEKALEATVRADEAALERAKIELKYCYIRSPLDGFAGEVKVDVGNVMKANDNDKPMVVIRQTSPIFAVFTVPERYLSEIKRQLALQPLQVEAAIPGQDERKFTGELTFIDNSVDTTTGTIQLKATFANGDNALWPGQYVNLALKLTDLPNSVLVPSQAVQMGQKGSFVYVLKPDQTVEYRLVDLGLPVGDQVVVVKGLTGGERVVTDGQLRLFPGAMVKIVADGQQAPKEARL
jgi:membrane fusion protein, multidrug efflux system